MIIEISRDKAIEYLLQYFDVISNEDLEKIVNTYLSSALVEYCIKE